MAPRKPATVPTTKGRKGAPAKRTREGETAAVAQGHAKRQKTLPAAQPAGPVPPLPASRSRSAAQPSASALPALNQRPIQPLNVYVLGANSAGELGLGPLVKSGNVARPLLNPFLSGAVGVVQVSLGAMHGVALTRDNRILTWGVNDHGALGRDTSWEGDLVDADANDNDGESDSDSDGEGELNPMESTPTQVDLSAVPADTVFAQVAAADNATFALTCAGRVYGWGAFRVSRQFIISRAPSAD